MFLALMLTVKAEMMTLKSTTDYLLITDYLSCIFRRLFSLPSQAIQHVLTRSPRMCSLRRVEFNFPCNIIDHFREKKRLRVNIFVCHCPNKNSLKSWFCQLLEYIPSVLPIHSLSFGQLAPDAHQSTVIDPHQLQVYLSIKTHFFIYGTGKLNRTV